MKKIFAVMVLAVVLSIFIAGCSSKESVTPAAVSVSDAENDKSTDSAGSMETGSYLLAGTKGAMEQTWGSTAHGSGRTMSRTQAKAMFRGDVLQKDMEKRGILVKTVSYAGLAEEAGAAYKDIDEVIEACHNAGISRKVVKLIPIGNVKG